MLTLYTTDGQNKIIGIEYQPINNLKEDDLIPGTKVCTLHELSLI